jgi:putative two-component system response regulator
MILALKCGADDNTVRETVSARIPGHREADISSEMLNKKEKLHEDEMAILRMHASTGYDYLSRHVDSRRDALAIVDQHHEWFNGAGYPRGLSDGEISTGAKYAAICDVFDAMITERPYKRAFSFREAMIFIIRGMARQFNPSIAGLFSER